MSEARCWSGVQPGDIRVRGFDTDILRAGRIEICHENKVKQVCSDGWNANAAMVACKQLMGPQGTVQYTQLYIGSNGQLYYWSSFRLCNCPLC